MNHASLFSGIGGFDLAAEWMGWTNVLHCERDPFCQRVLQYHFPNAKTYNDVKTFDGTEWRGRVDILTGGFPCQPYSSAGKRLGKDDERHLWPEMLRIIREAAPTYVVGENVRGLTNWNGGVVFEEVCADLEAEGYEVWTGILPAAGVGAPHRRDRVWFVAHANGGADVRTPGRDAGTGTGEGIPERHEVRIPDQSGDVRDAADTNGQRLPQPVADGKLGGKERLTKRGERPAWDAFPTQSPICGGDDGLPGQLDGITFPKWRAESIKAYGNAIVPQVAYQIFQAIQTTHDN